LIEVEPAEQSKGASLSLSDTRKPGNEGGQRERGSKLGGGEEGSNPQRIANPNLASQAPRVLIDMVDDDELGCDERITPNSVHQVSLGIINKPFPSSRPERESQEKRLQEFERNPNQFRVAQMGYPSTPTRSKTSTVMNQIELQVEGGEKEKK
jgi:hypothetical protein